MADRFIKIIAVVVAIVAVASVSYYGYAYALADTERVDFGSDEFHPEDSGDRMYGEIPQDVTCMKPVLFLRYQSAPYGERWFLDTNVSFDVSHGFGLKTLTIEYTAVDDSITFINVAPKTSDNSDIMILIFGSDTKGEFDSDSAIVEYRFAGDAMTSGDTRSGIGPVFTADRDTGAVKCVVTADFVRTDGIQKDHIIQTWEATVHLDVHDDSDMPIQYPFPE